MVYGWVHTKTIGGVNATMLWNKSVQLPAGSVWDKTRPTIGSRAKPQKKLKRTASVGTPVCRSAPVVVGHSVRPHNQVAPSKSKWDAYRDKVPRQKVWTPSDRRSSAPANPEANSLLRVFSKGRADVNAAGAVHVCVTYVKFCMFHNCLHVFVGGIVVFVGGWKLWLQHFAISADVSQSSVEEAAISQPVTGGDAADAGALTLFVGL